MIQDWANIYVRRLRQAQRKLGIVAAGFMPTGGATGEVLAKTSPVDYDVSWQPLLGGIIMVGNGLVNVGNTIHFAQAAAYTAGAIPFATGATTIGFSSRINWDNTLFSLDIVGELSVTNTTILNPPSLVYASFASNLVNINANNANEFGGCLAHSDHSAGGGNLTLNFLAAGYASAGMVGVKGNAIVSGVVTVDSCVATAGQCLLRNGCTITNAIGLLAVPFYNDVGINVTVTNAYGLYIKPSRVDGVGAVIGTQYGAYIATMWAVGTRYAIWQNGAADKNVFNGLTGIGMIPVRQLDVTGTFGATGISSLLGGVVIVAPTTLGAFGQSLETEPTSTAVAGTVVNWVLTPKYSPAAASSSSYQAIVLQCSSTGAQNFTGSIYGFNLQALHNSSGSCASLNGLSGVVRKQTTGSVTTATVISAQIINGNATGSVGTGYNFLASSPNLAATGFLTTVYGIYIDTQKVTNVTNGYGIYQVGTSDLNNLLGFTGAGIAASTSTRLILGASTTGISGLRFTQGPAPTAPVDGDMWTDSTEKSLDLYLNGIERHLSGTIFDQTASQTIANSTAETTLWGAGVGTLTLPANFWVTGSTIHCELRGTVANTGNPTGRVRAYLGATLLLDTTAVALGAMVGTEYWRLSLKMTCRTAGAPGTIACAMGFEYHIGNGANPVTMLETVPAVVNVTTTGALAINVTWTWGTANAANTITSIIGTASIQQ